jgi:hypothetical protein
MVLVKRIEVKAYLWVSLISISFQLVVKTLGLFFAFLLVRVVLKQALCHYVELY